MNRKSILPFLLKLWIVLFVIAPLLLTIGLSFLKRDPYGGFSAQLTLVNLENIWSTTYLGVLFKSLRLASLTALLCSLVGFPIAYVIATSKPRIQALYYALLLVPFWTNFIVRTHALRELFSPATLNIEVPPLFLIQLGMLLNYLPLFVLP